jgi:hypothetical protein
METTNQPEVIVASIEPPTAPQCQNNVPSIIIVHPDDYDNIEFDPRYEEVD